MATEVSDIPQWLQTASVLGTVIGASLIAMFRNKKKGDAEEVLPGVEHRVVAASFVEATLLRELIDAMTRLCGKQEALSEATMELEKTTSKLYDHLHEEAVIRATMARIIEQQKGRP